MTFVLTAVGAALAVALELFEALAIVLAVALTRRPARGARGRGGGRARVRRWSACSSARCSSRRSRATPCASSSGSLLLLFGMEWLRKGVLRLAGRRARSDSYAEFVAEREALADGEPPAAGRFDWPGFVIAFKGVLLEGVEVILIVTVLAARPGGAGAHGRRLGGGARCS